MRYPGGVPPRSPLPPSAPAPAPSDCAQLLHGLGRQGLRWLYAARQDRDPVVAYLHASYAARDLEHAVGAACRYGLPRAVEGFDLDVALEHARALQDRVQRYLIAALGGSVRA